MVLLSFLCYCNCKRSEESSPASSGGIRPQHLLTGTFLVLLYEYTVKLVGCYACRLHPAVAM